MLEKTVNFFNMDLAKDISMPGYPNISEAAVLTCTTTQSFLKIQKISQECTWTGVSFQLATFNFFGKQTPAYMDFGEFYFGTLLLQKTSIDRKLTLNLIVIFNSFTDISFVKYTTLLKYFVSLTIFMKKLGGVLRCSFQ